MKKLTLILALVTLFTIVFAIDNSMQTLEKTQIKTDISLPLYEKSSSFLANYRVNQTMRQTVRWTNIMTIAPVATVILFHNNSEFLNDPFAPLLLGALGGTLGFLGGSIGGAIHGNNLYHKKQMNPDLHTKRYQFGNECGTKITLTKVGSTSQFYYLNYQKLESIKFHPSEYRLGVIYKRWTNEDEEPDHNYSAEETKLDINVLFNSNRGYLQFSYGAGLGYSWGNNKDTFFSEDEYDDDDDGIVVRKNIEGFFLHPIGGATLNLADFMFIRLEVDYEFSTFYYKAKKYNDYPLAGNASLGLTFGTYLF